MTFWKKTQKGKVIYNRRKHSFSDRAIGRIISDVGAVATIFLADEEFNSIISSLMKDLNDLAPDAEFTFGGGEFGGGGAVRPFSEAGDEIQFLEEPAGDVALTFVPPRIENILVIMKPLPWKEN